MKQWFESLSRRDQIALLMRAGALLLWAYTQLIFIPLDGRRECLKQGTAALAEKLVRVDLKVAQLAALRSGKGSQPVNLTRTLSQASDASGLPVKRLQPNSRGEVQIRFESVPFDGVLRFLEQVEGISQLSVVDASISSAGKNGGVNATLRIAGQ